MDALVPQVTRDKAKYHPELYGAAWSTAVDAVLSAPITWTRYGDDRFPRHLSLADFPGAVAVHGQIVIDAGGFWK